MRNLIRALRGKPVELSAKQQEKLAKAQARADAMIAEQETKGRAAQAEYAAFMASQGQGGGASFGGPAPSPPAVLQGSVHDMFEQALESAKDSFGEMFDDRAGIIDPGPEADFNRPPPELDDPAERALRAAAERKARDKARAPYRSPGAPAVELTRFATTGRAQIEDVTARLRGYNPARVFGVDRVPDRHELKRNSENKVRIEWEIAHAPGATAASEVHLAAFNRAGHWVVRGFGEPSVLDEDVVGALVARANLQPEDCLSRHGPPRTPSPLPHLPSTYEELLTAYLEVVGIRSEDCYGVQTTRAATETGLADLSMASFAKNLSGYPELIHAAEHVVVAYRDSAGYEAGRARWRAYQDEVLHARLDHRSGQRPPLDTEYRPPPSFLSEVFDMFNPLDPLHAFPQIFNRNERPQLGPYTGPAEG